MEILNENITFLEIKKLLDDTTTRDQVLVELKTFSPDNDAVKGLVEFLKKNNWNYDSVLAAEVNPEKEFKQVLQKLHTKRKTRQMVAAVLFPLVGLSALLYIMLSSPSETDRLYNKYAEIEIGLPTLMDSSSKKDFDEAMAAFKDEDYVEAKEAFERLNKEGPFSNTLQYFLACSEMELGNFKEAISYFNKISETSDFKEKADFRLVLSEIKVNELAKAKILLDKIAANKSHSYHSLAIEMLKEPAFQK